jgi:hypothetical protein
VALAAARVVDLKLLSDPHRVLTPDHLADEADHDTFFSMERVTGDRPAIFLWSTLHAYRELLDERLHAGTQLGECEWLNLRYAFESIARHMLWEAPGVPPAATARTLSDRSGQNPLRRWIIGHRVFMALLQALILALHDLKRAVGAGREAEAVAAFDLSAIMLVGSACAFRFATDFSRAEYVEQVRPAMMPPVAVPGLSGALSHDHAFLMQVLATLRHDFMRLDGPRLQAAALRFRKAFEQMFDDHTLVCERCVGDRQPSLLTQMANSDTPAIDDLNRVRERRMQMLPPAQPQ